MEERNEEQQGVLYRMAKANHALHYHVTRLSNYGFTKWYTQASRVCMMLVGVCCLLCSERYPLVYGMGYLLGSWLSGLTVRVYMQFMFRNLVGVIVSAIAVPLLIAICVSKAYLGMLGHTQLQALCFVFVYLLFMLVYLIDWPLIKALWQTGGIRAFVQMRIGAYRREHMLNRELTQWDDTAFQRIKVKDWQMLNHQQRAAYVERMLACEMKQLGMQAPIELHRYEQGRGIHTVLEFIAEPERHRIAWNTDAVDWYPMEQIVQEMIFCLQRYQWYAVLTATERVAFADDWQALQLVCSRFCRESSVLAYDLLTNHYVYVRADWYCKYD